MIRYYKANMPGPYHLDNDIPCQDSYFILKSANGVVCAACADGLGSEIFSDVGSRIASQVAVEHCIANYSSELTFPEVKSIINNAFVYAYKAVLEEAQNAGNSSDEYDTTLCLAIYDSGHVYYGQSGDSGILVLLHTGEYVPVTTQQRDEDGYVFPLCSGPSKWVFGEVDGDVSSVMLMTDGVWEQMCPHVLRNHEIKVNVALVRKFMERHETSIKAVQAVEDAANQYLKNYPRRLLDDDKTVVVIYDTDRRADRMPDSYYEPPNWEAIHDEARMRLYGSVKPEEIADVDDAEDTADTDGEELAESNDGNPVSEDGLLKPETGDANSATVRTAVNQSEKIKKPPPGEESINLATSIDNRRPKASPAKANSIAKRQGSHRPIPQGAVANSTLNRLYSHLSLVLLLIFSIAAFAMSGFVRTHAPVSYLGVFIVCFVANSTVLLPAPSILIVLQYAQILDPLLVAMCGAIGASLGEMVGFLAGTHGRYMVGRKRIRKLQEVFPNHPYFFVFVFAALPLPLFDVVGLLAGAIHLDTLSFYVSCLSGKLVKMLMFVWIGQAVSVYFT